MAVAILGELTDRGLAVISGLGERLLAPILAAAIRARGLQAEFVDAGELIVTDDNYASAAPDMDATRAATRGRLLPLLEQGVVPVVTGFVAATPDGVPTVLGRGGSDYSAAILGAALDADEIQIWTDVDGVLTADPRIVQGRPAAAGADLQRGRRAGLLRRQGAAPQDHAAGHRPRHPDQRAQHLQPGLPRHARRGPDRKTAAPSRR